MGHYLKNKPDFSEIIVVPDEPADEESIEYGIRYSEVHNNHELKGTIDNIYSELLLERLRVKHKTDSIDFIAFQLRLSSNPKRWFKDLKKLIDFVQNSGNDAAQILWEIQLSHLKEVIANFDKIATYSIDNSDVFDNEINKVDNKVKGELISIKNDEFLPIKGEIQRVRLSQIKYSAIAKPEAFSEVEKYLYKKGIIDIDYQFIKSKKNSNSKLLGLVVRFLFINDFFRKNTVGYNKEISLNIVREYIENRYSTDLKQQVRRSKDEDFELLYRKLPFFDKSLKL
jgi:hypothetical protein